MSDSGSVHSFVIIWGEPDAAVRAARICADHGVRVGCFRPPSVPKGRACLRLTARADLTEAELELVRDTLTTVRDSAPPI